MSRWAKNSSRVRTGTIAMLAMALSACANNDDAMAEKLAAAEAAADKAVAAQHAAEKAAAIAAGIRPAPVAEPTVMAETDSQHENLRENDEDDRFGYDNESQFTMGGSGQTVSPDGVVIPGQGV